MTRPLGAPDRLAKITRSPKDPTPKKHRIPRELGQTWAFERAFRPVTAVIVVKNGLAGPLFTVLRPRGEGSSPSPLAGGEARLPRAKKSRPLRGGRHAQREAGSGKRRK